MTRTAMTPCGPKASSAPSELFRSLVDTTGQDHGSVNSHPTTDLRTSVGWLGPAHQTWGFQGRRSRARRRQLRITAWEAAARAPAAVDRLAAWPSATTSTVVRIREWYRSAGTDRTRSRSGPAGRAATRPEATLRTNEDQSVARLSVCAETASQRGAGWEGGVLSLIGNDI
jgi:hypothetical protein